MRRPLPPGVGWGALGVLAFSLTFPASRAALPAFGPVTVGLGRAVVASALAAVALSWARAPRPTPGQLRRLGLVASGVVVGFPLCSSLALRDATASHGAVLIGLLPAATAAIAVVRGGEHTSGWFWAAGGIGALSVLVFAAVQGGGTIAPADGWLLGAVVLGALGYAVGGALARELGGWQVICWALLLALPVVAPVTAIGLAVHPPQSPSLGAWLGLAYVCAISMFAGFFAWYRGLAEGGIARVSQLQLAQPVLTLAWSALLLGEPVDRRTVVAALVVVGAVALTQRTRPTSPAALVVEPAPGSWPSSGSAAWGSPAATDLLTRPRRCAPCRPRSTPG